MEARFSATPQAFTLEQAVLTSGNSRFTLAATVRDYSQPKLHATYEAAVDSGEFRHVLKNPSLPLGLIQLSGVLDSSTEPNRPLLATTKLAGDLSSSALSVLAQKQRVTIRDIAAHYSVAQGNAEITGMRARLLGGALAGTLTMRNLTSTPRSHLSASLRDISLAELQRIASPTSVEQAKVAGAVNATAEANWGRTMNDLVARANATLTGSMQPARGGQATPVDGVVHASYSALTKQIALAQSYVRTPQTSIDMNGMLGDRSALQVRMQSEELHELEAIAAAFRAPNAAPLGLYGRASLVGDVRGSTKAPRINGQLTASNLRVHGTAWKLFRTGIAASPSEARLENGELQPATRGRIAFQLRTALAQWSFTKASRFQAQLTASEINVGELAKAAGSTAPISGTLNANVSASGTQLAPLGHGTIRLADARIASEPVRAVDVRFEGTGTQLNTDLRVELPAGIARAMLQYQPKPQAYVAELRAMGLRLDRLETVKTRNMQLKGTLNATASGRGTLSDPQLQALVEVPQLQIRDQVIRGLKLQANVAQHVANFALDSQLLNTYARGRGKIQLTDGYLADIAVDTQAIPLQPIVAMYAPSQAANLSGQTELHATLRGPLKQKDRVEAHIVIPQLALNYRNTVQLAAAAPIRADFANNVLELQHSAIRGTGTDLEFQAHVPMAAGAPASMLVRGAVDLRLAQLLNPDITSGGQLRFNIDSYGQRSNPNVHGSIQIVNASFAAAGAPVGLQNGNGVLTLTRDRLDVTQFRGDVGGGTVTASGGVVYRPAMRFDLAMAAQGVRILYAQTVRTTVNTNLALTGTTTDALLHGQVGVEQLAFTPDFDLMEFTKNFGGEATPPPAEGFTQELRLDIGIETPGGLSLASRELSLEGAANLHVRGTAAQPVLLGRVNIGGGDLIFLGNRYVLQGGTIDFRNPSRTEPVVDASVSTTIQQYDIQMHFWGPADHLHTNYSSDPALPPADIINLIAFGKTVEAGAANPTPSGSLGAQSLVASQVSSRVTSRLEKLAGISHLSVDPVLGSSQQSPGARIAVQQRVTSKVFVTFATDVTSTQRQIIKFEYQLSPKTSLNAVRDQNGGFSFETRFRKRW
jgi:translocation and assembly module TamB